MVFGLDYSAVSDGAQLTDSAIGGASDGLTVTDDGSGVGFEGAGEKRIEMRISLRISLLGLIHIDFVESYKQTYRMPRQW